MLALALSSTAFGCSLAGPEVLQLVTGSNDVEAPATPALSSVDVGRGRGPDHGRSTSCDDLGFITITVARPDDDADGDADVGYRFELVDGELPDGLGLPSELWLGPELGLSWIDGATDDQEPFSFTLSLTPVDAAGNEGEPLLVDVSDEGSEAGPVGCDHVGGVGLLGLLGLAPTLLLARRR